MIDQDQPRGESDSQPARLTVREIATFLGAVSVLLIAVAVLVSAVMGHPVQTR